MTAIISFSARRAGGKTTCCNFIMGHCLSSLGIVHHGFKITPQGKLWVEDLFGDTNQAGELDVRKQSRAMKKFLNTHVDKYVKLYSFAAPIKQKLCVEILGLKPESVYGSNAQKDEPTHLLWENMRGVITPDKWAELSKGFKTSAKFTPEDFGLYMHEPGPMSGREVMQFVGTEVFRRMYENIWADALFREIEADNPEIALIDDPRFPDQEVAGIKQRNGIIIRLTRVAHPEDVHDSETALDEERYDWSNFNFIIENEGLSIPDQNLAVYEILKQVGIFTE